MPVDQIAATAERIGSHNLSQRLPVANTGDELERLSITLNHMIQRLEQAFQHSRRFMADASHELRTPSRSPRRARNLRPGTWAFRRKCGNAWEAL